MADNTKIKMLLLSALVFFTSFGQNDTSHKLPPIEILSQNGNLTEIFALPYEADFKIYNRQGILIESGFGQFIDRTNYENGIYFVKYHDCSL